MYTLMDTQHVVIIIKSDLKFIAQREKENNTKNATFWLETWRIFTILVTKV